LCVDKYVDVFKGFLKNEKANRRSILAYDILQRVKDVLNMDNIFEDEFINKYLDISENSESTDASVNFFGNDNNDY